MNFGDTFREPKWCDFIGLPLGWRNGATIGIIVRVQVASYLSC